MPPSPAPRPSTSKPSKPNNNSLSSIVSHLVRSSYGSTSALSSVPDDQLDRHVAEMLLSEAKEKQKAWGTKGNRAYIDDDEEAPIRKTNKRFLTNMIRNVDDHNKALLRTEAEASRRREREEKEAAESWRRSQNRSEADLRLGGGGEGSSRDDRRQRYSDGEDSEAERRRRRRRREREEEDQIDEEESAARRRRRREDSGEIKEKSSKRHHKEEESQSTSRHHHTSRSRHSEDEDKPRSSRRSGNKSSRSDRDGEHRHRSSRADDKKKRRREDSEDDRDTHQRNLSLGKEPLASTSTRRSPDPLSVQRSSKSTSETYATPPGISPPGISPPPAPSGPPPSKMDKYFLPSYDPLLDISPPSPTSIPSTGLINDADFAGWERMLDVVKERKEGKKERERREKEERKEGRDKVRRERERRKRGESSDEEVGPKVFDSSGGLMEINGYAKRGGVREWDQGKVN